MVIGLTKPDVLAPNSFVALSKFPTQLPHLVYIIPRKLLTRYILSISFTDIFDSYYTDIPFSRMLNSFKNSFHGEFAKWCLFQRLPNFCFQAITFVLFVQSLNSMFGLLIEVFPYYIFGELHNDGPYFKFKMQSMKMTRYIDTWKVTTVN